MNLTPIQKLARLKALHLQIGALPQGAALTPHVMTLFQEQDAILSTVGSPPPELEGNTDPAAWAIAFAGNFPTFDFETALEWFGGQSAASYRLGHVDGAAVGAKNAAEAFGLTELVDTLKLVRDGLKAGRIKAPPIANAAAPVGTPARALVELIVETLAHAGVRE